MSVDFKIRDKEDTATVARQMANKPQNPKSAPTDYFTLGTSIVTVCTSDCDEFGFRYIVLICIVCRTCIAKVGRSQGNFHRETVDCMIGKCRTHVVPCGIEFTVPRREGWFMVFYFTSDALVIALLPVT
jgi:hypothetical protein